jgi:capsular polysaccharide biosynthesis protein
MPADQRHRSGDEGLEPDLSAFLGRLRRTWLPIMLAAVLAGSSAYVVSQRALPAVYESSATIIIIPQPPAAVEARANPALNGFVPDQSIAETFRQLGSQMAVASVASEDLRVSDRRLRRLVSVHAVPRTPLLRVSARSEQPDEATRLARGYSAALVRVADSERWVPGVELELASPAGSPGTQVAPRPLLNAAVAAMLALLLSFTLAGVADRWRARRRKPAAQTGRSGRASRHPSSSSKAADPEWAS